jgi:hypothetical protein
MVDGNEHRRPRRFLKVFAYDGDHSAGRTRSRGELDRRSRLSECTRLRAPSHGYE